MADQVWCFQDRSGAVANTCFDDATQRRLLGEPTMLHAKVAGLEQGFATTGTHYSVRDQKSGERHCPMVFIPSVVFCRSLWAQVAGSLSVVVSGRLGYFILVFWYDNLQFCGSGFVFDAATEPTWE